MLLDLYLILTTGICINAALEESKGFQKNERTLFMLLLYDSQNTYLSEVENMDGFGSPLPAPPFGLSYLGGKIKCWHILCMRSRVQHSACSAFS